VNVVLLGGMTVAAVPVQTPSPTVAWIRQFGFGTPFRDAALGISVWGPNVYVAGSTEGALSGQTALGGSDAFLRKYDKSGNEVWTRQFGTNLGDAAVKVYADSSGVYVAGEQNETEDRFGVTNQGFLSRYTLDGSMVWTRSFGDTPLTEVTGVTGDRTGVYVVGSADVCGGAWCRFVHRDAYIIKYDSNSTQLSARKFGLTSGATGVSSDPTGAYVSGFVRGTLPGQSLNDSSYVSGFVRKFDISGNEIWTRQFSISAYTQAASISAGSSAVFVAVWTFDKGLFLRSYTRDGNLAWSVQTGYGGSVFASPGGVYVVGPHCVQKYDFKGNFQWTLCLGTSGFDFGVTTNQVSYVNGAATNNSADIYLAGDIQAAFPGESVYGFMDAFVVKLSNS